MQLGVEPTIPVSVAHGLPTTLRTYRAHPVRRYFMVKKSCFSKFQKTYRHRLFAPGWNLNPTLHAYDCAYEQGLGVGARGCAQSPLVNLRCYGHICQDLNAFHSAT